MNPVDENSTSYQQKCDRQQAKGREEQTGDKYHSINVSLISVMLKTVVNIMPCNTERQMSTSVYISSDKGCVRKAMRFQIFVI